MTLRTKEHIKEAEYVGSCFNVLLSYNHRTLDVTNYTFGLPPIVTRLEDETSGYGKAILSRLSIDFDREEVEGYLTPLPDNANEIGITIKHYLFGNSGRYRIFTGVAEDLPAFRDNASEDKLTITFVSRLGTLGDGDNIVDPDTGEEYRYIEVNDFIRAFDIEFGSSVMRTADVPVNIRADERWWSSLFRPNKKRIIDSSIYDNTVKPKAIASDDTYLYYPINSWLIRFNPKTGVEKRIAQIGHGTEIIYLECDGGDIHYITDETDTEGFPNRGYGSSNLSNIGPYIFPDEYFYKYDGGCRVYAKNILRANLAISGDTDPAPASWDTQMIGDGNVPPDKNLSSGRPFRGVQDAVMSSPDKGLNYVIIDGTLVDLEGVPADWINLIGWWCQVEDTGNNRSQQLGRVTKIGWKGGYVIYFERPFTYDYNQATTLIFFFPPEVWPTNNLMIPAYRNYAIDFDKDELSDRDIQDVIIEKRLRPEGKQSFYYPDTLAELGDGDDILLEPGYVSMTACDTAEEFSNNNEHEEYIANTCAGFSIFLDWIDRQGQYLLADGFRVENDMQGSDYVLCGENRVTYNGNNVNWNTTYQVKSYGNIYLFKGDNIYIGVNEIKYKDYKYYTRMHFGRWNSDTKRFDHLYLNREDDTGDNYQLTTPPVEKNGIIYGGAKLYNKNLVKTGLQIVWARPPQGTFKPNDNDGGYTATVLIPGDHLDLLDKKGHIRIGSTADGDAGAKEYIISEAQVVTRQLNDASLDHTVAGYGTTKGKWTHLILKSIDFDIPAGLVANPYEVAVKGELLGKYISVMQGWDIRSIAYKLEGGTFSVIDTATREAGESPEGKENEEEIITVEYDDEWSDCPRISLDETRVLTGVRCWLKDQELTGTDYTDELRVSEPLPGEFYYRRNQGGDFKTTYLYLNDIYTNLDVRVEYEYYPENAEFRNFVVFNDNIFYNETGDLNKWRSYAPAIASLIDDYSVGVREEGFYSNLTECDGVLYGITYPSYTIRQYYFAWSGYIEYAKTENVRAWDILGLVSSACDCALYERLNEYVFKSRLSFNYRGELELYGAIKKSLIIPFKKVIIVYANGVATVGEGKPEYSRNCDYISDYRHALIIANAVYNAQGLTKYEIEMLTFRDDIELGDMFSFNQVSGIVVEVGLNPSPPYKSRLVLYESNVGIGL